MNSPDLLQQTEFNWRTTLMLTNASNLTYRSGRDIERIVTRDWGFDHCKFISKEETQLFIARTDTQILICFRGTQGTADWLRNLKVTPTGQLPYGRVHRGFHKAYQDIKDDLQTYLEAHADGKQIWVAGHSLGGALASICLAEIQDDYGNQVVGCYTFGQPRTGNRAFVDFINGNYPGLFYRFVNDDDVVARIPPGYTHVGQLIHFAPDGELLTAPFLELGSHGDSDADEAPIEDVDEFDPSEEEGIDDSGSESFGSTEPEPLSEAEFEALQAQLQEVILFEDNLSNDLAAEGFFPSISDHYMEGYLNHVRFHAFSTPMSDEMSSESMRFEAKVDLNVQDSASEIRERGGVGVLGGDVGTENESIELDLLPILIRANAAWAPPEDLIINSQIGSVYTALATTDQIAALQTDSWVLSVTGSRDTYVEEAVESLPFIRADRVHRGPLQETGDAAIIGIIDTGIDILHEAFRDRNDPSKTRILYIWDQKTNSTTRNPNRVDHKFSARYGRLYTEDDIQDMIDRGDVGSNQNLRDKHGHGTHVAGIAAGRAVGDLSDGVAPDAKIIFVIPRLNTEPGDPRSLGYSVTHLDGLLFLKEAAQIEKMPMAVNLSLGMNAGSHDGTSPLEIAIDGITSKGRDPGLVIVKSAGNERGHRGHARAFATKNLIETISWRSENKVRSKDSIEAWFNDFDDIAFRLISPSRHRTPIFEFDPLQDDPTSPKTGDGKIGQDHYELSLIKNHPDNGNSQLEIIIKNKDDKPIRPGEWKLEIIGKSIHSQDGRIDFWIERNNKRAIEFELGMSDEMTLSVPGTADSVIVVAACEAEGPPIRLTGSSSYGPTRLGRPKPEITAPGFRIHAAKSNTDDHQEGTAKTGTSMAAPHVTGAIALLLSKIEKGNPSRQLNGQQIRQLMIQNSTDFSASHHPGRGFGILDVEKFIESVP